ncbi:MAG: cold-shock protein [Lysobacterales bacterium]
MKGSATQNGTVKWFDDCKGYGFISPGDGSPDLFVHFSSMKGPGFKTLREGQKVTFRAVQSRRGLEAQDVQ